MSFRLGAVAAKLRLLPCQRWNIGCELREVRFWPLADVVRIRLNVRLWGQNGRDQLPAQKILSESGPNADAVRRRWALERNAEFATNVITVETERPLNETVATVVRAVWMAL
jgi:hypothetical protein